jgi:hypothetical protein
MRYQARSQHPNRRARLQTAPPAIYANSYTLPDQQEQDVLRISLTVESLPEADRQAFMRVMRKVCALDRAEFHHVCSLPAHELAAYARRLGSCH